jgi:hypothetical protein
MMFAKKGWYIILFVLILAIIEAILIFNKIMVDNPLYTLIQNLLISIFVTPLLVDNFKLSIHQAPRLKWMVAAIIVSFLPTTATIMASVVNYFIDGGKGLVSINNGTIPITIETTFLIVSGLLFVLVFQILVSAIAGLLPWRLFDSSRENSE